MALSLVPFIGLTGCDLGGHDPERYVLTGNDKNLFFERQLAVDPGKADEVIATVKSFSRIHGMDFLLARESLPRGEFNVSANSPTINISAMHSTSVGDTEVQIFAIVPKVPTEQDRALVAEFVAGIEKVGTTRK